MIARAYLFVPGNRPERFDKALAAGADALIVDLEDAVPAQDKATARAATSQWLAGQQRGKTGLLVRINGVGTEWFDDDLAACRLPAVSGVVLPKAQTIDELRRVADALGQDLGILPLIESAQGMANATTLAAQPGVRRLVFGTIDFQLDMGIEGEDEELLYFRSQLVLASRLANIQAPVDGVTTTLGDAEVVFADARRARGLGFGAKLCIHPKQVDPVLRAWRPTSEEIAWARRVAEAERSAAGAAVALDGKMVDKPVILKAHEILSAAQSDS